MSAVDSAGERPPVSFDVHTHILPKTWPNWKEKFGYGGFIWLDHEAEGENAANMMRDDGHFFRTIQDNCWCGVATPSAVLERGHFCWLAGISILA